MNIQYTCKICLQEHEIQVRNHDEVELPINCEGCGAVVPERALEEVLEAYYNKCQPQPEDDLQ